MADMEAHFARALIAQTGVLPAASAVGKLYHPSNGTEGETFISQWCAHCIHDKAEDWEDEFGNDVEGRCDVLTNAYIGPVDAWVYRDGKPVCLLFKEDPTNPARCLTTKEMF